MLPTSITAAGITGYKLKCMAWRMCTCAARGPSWKDVESSIAWWPEAGSGLGHLPKMATSRDNSKNNKMIFKGFPPCDSAKKHSSTD